MVGDRGLFRAQAARPLRRRAHARDGGARHAEEPAAARALAGAGAGPGAGGQSRRGGAEPALPQPPRLCAADALPPLRLPLPMPQLHRLDGRAPLHPAARLPPLRPCHARAAGLPGMQGGGQPRRLRPRRRAHRRRGRGALPRRAHRDRHLGHDLVAGQGGRFRRADGERRDRHRRRHPIGHQGLSFPEPDPGRRRRCGPRAGRRRSARGRAHLPADPPGLRPRRARRQARPRPRPDPRSFGAR